jgi:hypothetical protein
VEAEKGYEFLEANMSIEALFSSDLGDEFRLHRSSLGMRLWLLGGVSR